MSSALEFVVVLVLLEYPRVTLRIKRSFSYEIIHLLLCFFSGLSRTITLGFITNGLPAMKNPDALRIFFPDFCGGKYKPLKKHNSRWIIS
jgi:hypothetical protein